MPVRHGCRTVSSPSGSLNLNVHLHALVPDGVFARARTGGVPVFHALPAPGHAEVEAVPEGVHRRVERVVARRTTAPEPSVEVPDSLAEEAPLLAACYAASVQGRRALGARAGRRVSLLSAARPQGFE